MILIGIGGDSAVGKTTASEYIRSKTSGAIIHLDFVLNEIKKKYFADNIKVCDSHSGEYEHVVLTSFPIEIDKEKMWHKRVKSGLVSFVVLRKIKQLKQEGYEVVVVEGRNFDCLAIDFDLTIHIRAREDNRISRLMLRDNQPLTRRQLLEKDSISNKRKIIRQASYNRGVENDGSLEEFEMQLEKILGEFLPQYRSHVMKLVP